MSPANRFLRRHPSLSGRMPAVEAVVAGFVVLVLFALLVAWIAIVPKWDVPVRSDHHAQQHRLPSVRTPNPVLRQRLWQQMTKLDDGRGLCPGCLRGKHFEDFHLDHIVPKTKGGADYDHNIQLLCHNCNVTKGSGTMGDLDMRLARRGLRPSQERRREVAARAEAATPEAAVTAKHYGDHDSGARQRPQRHRRRQRRHRVQSQRNCEAGQHLWQAFFSPSAPNPVLAFCHDVEVDTDNDRFGRCRWYEKLGHIGHMCFYCGATVIDRRHQ